MNFTELMLTRRSVRTYNGKPLPENALDEILQSGLLAPSSRNRKSADFVAVMDKSILKQLAECKASGADMLSNAECGIVVIGDTEKSDVWIEDCSIAMTCMHLKAAELGVGSCWIQCRCRTSRFGNSSDEFVRQMLGIPDNYSVLAILSLGMTDTVPKPHTLSEADNSKIHINSF